jgi:NAD(P)-dependent dehydrogenase (short-subunit alcohol dehydrogenase family)
MSTPSLDGRVALITGGGRGLGLSFARHLGALGAACVIAEKDEAAGQAAEAALRSEGVTARFVPVDVTQCETVDRAAARCLEEFGRLDIWINNAGVALHRASEEVTAESWDLSIAIMLSGTFYGCRAAGRIMLENGGGTIINIASINGMVAQSGRAAYSAAKAGVIRLTEVLAGEWGPRKVRVNAIAPGVILTELSERAIKSGAATVEIYEQRTPAKRLGRLDELRNAVVFLASDASSYVTGQTLRVDGGWVSDHFL